ncbi:hypothetical protein ACROYT_G038978 [Oculina patagonica]
MMAKCVSPLPRISEENDTNGDAMAAEPTVPRVQKVHWTDENISQEWLKRMSSIKTSVFAVKPGINLINTMSVQVTKAKPQHWNTKSYSQENVNKLGEQPPLECFKGNSQGRSLRQSLPTNSLKDEEICKRTPDSTYIGLQDQHPNEKKNSCETSHWTRSLPLAALGCRVASAARSRRVGVHCLPAARCSSPCLSASVFCAFVLIQERGIV